MGDLIDLTAYRMHRSAAVLPDPAESEIMTALLDMYMHGEVEVSYHAGEMRFKLDRGLNEGPASHDQPPSTGPV